MDYRDSHLCRGDDYDATISGNPFDAYMAKCEAQYLREIVPRLASCEARYLDFACGTGRITSTVGPLVGESVGVDVSDSMLVEARRKCPSTRFICADLTRQDVDVGQFDLVTSFRFFGNAEDKLRDAALRALSRATRRNGFLIVNNHRNPHAISVMLRRLRGGTMDVDLTHRKLERMLGTHGFRVVRRHAIGFWIFRGRLATLDILGSPFASIADRAFRHGVWAPFAPDCVVVAQRQ